jgi:hypothetical protein
MASEAASVVAEVDTPVAAIVVVLENIVVAVVENWVAADMKDIAFVVATAAVATANSHILDVVSLVVIVAIASIVGLIHRSLDVVV